MHNPFMGSVSDYCGSKRFKKVHKDGKHTDDISTLNYEDI